MKASTRAAAPAPPAPDPFDLHAPAEVPAQVAAMVRHVAERFPGTDAEIVGRAYRLAEHAHRKQKRASGEPYVTHPLAVAVILDELGLDPYGLAAALLHDVVEDSAYDQADIERLFGKEVARLVAGVTKISELEAMDAERPKEAAEAESLRRLLLATVNDLRVILIKLADRLHNMETLDALKPERRARMARETLEIYAPLANRLGVWEFKSQFEDLALKALEPEAYWGIREALAARQVQQEAYLANAIAVLDRRLREHGIKADIKSRAKHITSIYRKMRRKELPAEQIYDVLALRVLVDEVATCYLTLGVVHTLWQPVEGEFDDYIAKRKNNLYQSLHTSVLGPDGRPLEVQIRTREMDEVAEYGVAAHWKYKENTRHSADFQEKIAALRRIFESHDEAAADAEAFVESLKTDVFADQVYVVTPKGDVIDLPKGSTAIDFAYRIHTEVGHRCRGALVDGRMVGLDTPLQTGQKVSIITAPGEAGPSRDWLNPVLGYTASSRARDKIRQWFRRQQRSDAIRDGREVLERCLRKLGLTRIKHEDVAHLLDHEKLDDFLAAVGRHEIPAEAISARLLEREAKNAPGSRVEQAHPGRQTPRKPMPTGAAPRPTPGAATGVSLLGAEGVHTQVARCCGPLPGDPVLGYITRGRGVTLHRADCSNIARQRDREPDRFIRVDWQRDDGRAYPVELRISAYDRSGLVRDITEIMSQKGLRLTSLSAAANPTGGTAIITVVVALGSLDQLAGVIDRLERVENVIDVRRPSG
jgi:RelA/SpoT family (p)ppGpp synthetase